MVERSAREIYSDPVMKKFIDLATETVFGALWESGKDAGDRLRCRPSWRHSRGVCCAGQQGRKSSGRIPCCLPEPLVFSAAGLPQRDAAEAGKYRI